MLKFVLKSPEAERCPKILAGLLTAGLLAGCGSSPPSPLAGNTARPAPEATALATPEPSARSENAPVAAARQTTAAKTTRPPATPWRADERYAGHPGLDSLVGQLASAHGLDAAALRETLGNARKITDAQRFIMPVSNPGAKNWLAYRQRFIEPVRLKAGVAFWKQNQTALSRAEKQFGVPARIIVGIIGVETIYGRQQGQYRVLDVLTTLSLDFPTGRSDRSAFFQSELGHWLAWCQETRQAPESMRGSFAGAMGLPQFMPSALRQHAIDFDGDGQIDLTRSAADAIGSVANYLAHQGWQRGVPTHFSVTPPSTTAELSRLLAPDILPTFSAAEMAQAGARLSVAGRDHDGPLALVLLHNADKAPTFVAGTHNFYAITRYNQSSYYALAVIELANEVAKHMPEPLLVRQP